MEMHETQPEQQAYPPRFKLCASCIQFKQCVFMGIKFDNHCRCQCIIAQHAMVYMAACKFHFCVLVAGTVFTYVLHVRLHRQKMYI